jgi:hypothetical protein
MVEERKDGKGSLSWSVHRLLGQSKVHRTDDLFGVSEREKGGFASVERNEWTLG